MPTKASPAPWAGGLQLPLMKLDVADAKAAIESLAPDVWTHEWQEVHSAVMGGRSQNMAAFKPGVLGITLLFSAGTGEGTVYEFPMHARLAHVLEPLIEEVRGVGAGCFTGRWLAMAGARSRLPAGRRRGSPSH